MPAADPQLVRDRTVKGWAFRDLPDGEVAMIRAYLKDGDPAGLAGTGYVRSREVVIDCLTPAERKRTGMPAAVKEARNGQR